MQLNFQCFKKKENVKNAHHHIHNSLGINGHQIHDFTRCGVLNHKLTRLVKNSLQDSPIVVSVETLSSVPELTIPFTYIVWQKGYFHPFPHLCLTML